MLRTEDSDMAQTRSTEARKTGARMIIAFQEHDNDRSRQAFSWRIKGMDGGSLAANRASG